MVRPTAARGSAPDDLPIIAFKSSTEWKRWLHRNHSGSPGIWVRIFKKGSTVPSVTIAEALDEALCYGWIDGQRRGFDERSYLQRYTPRRSRSVWSKINRENVARLVRDKRMQPAGLKEVARAREDGRWDAAYDSPSQMTLPEDFTKALARNKKALAFSKTLNRQNIYAIGFRLHAAKKPETRERRIAQFVEMLADGRKIHS